MIKKSIAVFAALLLMTSTMQAYSIEAIEITGLNCTQLALDVADAYEAAGYNNYESWQAGNWAYEGCVSNGGDPGNVVNL